MHGLIYDESFHYLDHLAPFCALMGWPLIALEPAVTERAYRYYPDLKVIDALPPLTPIVACEPRSLLRAALNAPDLQTFWLPHGNSDKGWKAPFFEALQESEPAFVYGEKMIDFMREKKTLAKTIRVGNFRWAYFQKHKHFYTQTQIELGLPQGRKNFLYAPTWDDSENNCSFWHAFPLLAENLPESCNLIVKWHPNTYRLHEARLERMIGQYANRKNIVFISDFPPIYPLLEICDAYIGDMSSIGYDFLKFSRPMFFLNPQKRDAQTDRGLYLHRCGREIHPHQISSLFSLCDNREFTEIQRKTYDYTFDTDVTLPLVIS